MQQARSGQTETADAAVTDGDPPSALLRMLCPVACTGSVIGKVKL